MSRFRSEDKSTGGYKSAARIECNPSPVALTASTWPCFILWGSKFASRKRCFAKNFMLCTKTIGVPSPKVSRRINTLGTISVKKANPVALK